MLKTYTVVPVSNDHCLTSYITNHYIIVNHKQMSELRNFENTNTMTKFKYELWFEYNG